MRDLNHAYVSEPALHALDAEPGGFDWLISDDADNSVYAFRRVDGAGREVVTICNFTPMPRHGYRVGMPKPGQWDEIVNTDSDVYGGSNMGNGGRVSTEPVASHGKPQSVALVLPPLGTLILRAAR